MKLTLSQMLLMGSGSLVAALPHMDSPRQRLLNGLDLKGGSSVSSSSSSSSSRGNPYTPDHRDPYDYPVDPESEDLDPLPWRNGLGASVLGPWNKERSRQDPDLVRPPSTDHGQISNMRWSFADSHIRIEEGGWTRQTTVRELPTSVELAGVNMRLDRGLSHQDAIIA